jgi:hypothetical protein
VPPFVEVVAAVSPTGVGSDCALGADAEVVLADGLRLRVRLDGEPAVARRIAVVVAALEAR